MPQVDRFPPEYSADHLRAAYPDLAGFSDEQMADHYARFGRSEGRAASPAAYREDLLARLDLGVPALEIGPFFNPALRGAGVRYLDVFNTDELRGLAVEQGCDPTDCPYIDYVGDLSIVDETFDLVFGSHSIEHQPDLVRHLQEVERVLNPGGVYLILAPDKRYCFDHYIPESTIADVLGSHTEGRTNNTDALVIAQVALITHNDPVAHWNGYHGPRPDEDEGLPRVREALAHLESSRGAYMDCHAWRFTPQSFRRIVAGLKTLGLTGLEIARIYDTPRNRFEFAAVLVKPEMAA